VRIGDRRQRWENIIVHTDHCDIDPAEPESRRKTVNLSGVLIDGDGRSRSGDDGSRMYWCCVRQSSKKGLGIRLGSYLPDT
jgi:hypothetical protein